MISNKNKGFLAFFLPVTLVTLLLFGFKVAEIKSERRSDQPSNSFPKSDRLDENVAVRSSIPPNDSFEREHSRSNFPEQLQRSDNDDQYVYRIKSPATLIVSKESIEEDVRRLASDQFEGRLSGKRGADAAASYIADQLSPLRATKQEFAVRLVNPGPENERGTGRAYNLIFTIPGKSDREIVLGAHYDHIGYGPELSRDPNQLEVHNGADDNASGCSVLLGNAKTLSRQIQQPSHTIKIIFFGAEELGLIGSRYYVSQLSEEEISKIDLMINYDMVGWLRGNPQLAISGIEEVPEYYAAAREVDDNYPFEVRAAGVGSGGSDHAPFANEGVPFVFYHTGAHRYYHTPDDDADLIDFEGLTNICNFSLEVLNRFDSMNLRRVRKAVYPELNSNFHDHGFGVSFESRFEHLDGGL